MRDHRRNTVADAPTPARRAPAAFAWLAGLALFTVAAQAVSLQARLEQLAATPDAGKAVVAVHVRDLDDGATVAAIEADRRMIPASNMKLLTTAAAVKLLGDDFRFSTRLYQQGDDLVVVGDGDPAFGDPAILHAMDMDVEDMLDRWVDVVQRAGIERVDRLMVDDRVFDDQHVHPLWPAKQLNRWYCAPVAGLNFNDNCLDVFARPTAPGQTAVVTTRPVDAPVVLTTIARTGRRNSLWASRRIGTNRITVHGEVKARFRRPIYVTIHDPPTFFARTYADRLEAAKVTVGSVRRVPPTHNAGGRLLAEVRTPLDEVLKRCNRDSQNLFAEALLKRMGHEATGEAGAWSNGAAAVRMFLARTLGPDASAFAVSDGSGLSRDNRVTPQLLTQLLRHMKRDGDVDAKLFFNSLPVAGEHGTLRRRFAHADLAGDIHAKSGYLDGVYALSGYLVQNHNAYAFSIILNDADRAPYRGRAVIDRMVGAIDKALADAAPQPAPQPDAD